MRCTSHPICACGGRRCPAAMPLRSRSVPVRPQPAACCGRARRGRAVPVAHAQSARIARPARRDGRRAARSARGDARTGAGGRRVGAAVVRLRARCSRVRDRRSRWLARDAVAARARGQRVHAAVRHAVAARARVLEQNIVGAALWTNSSLYQPGTTSLALAARWLGVPLGAWPFVIRPLDPLALGHDAAAAVGVRMDATRLAATVVAVAYVSAAVGIMGPPAYGGVRRAEPAAPGVRLVVEFEALERERAALAEQQRQEAEARAARRAGTARARGSGSARSPRTSSTLRGQGCWPSEDHVGHCMHMNVTYFPLMSADDATVKPVVDRADRESTALPVPSPVITQLGVDA